jgi:hypothetical protein
MTSYHFVGGMEQPTERQDCEAEISEWYASEVERIEVIGAAEAAVRLVI